MNRIAGYSQTGHAFRTNRAPDEISPFTTKVFQDIGAFAIVADRTAHGTGADADPDFLSDDYLLRIGHALLLIQSMKG